jgi:ATP-binding cassette, subfamily B, bacterial
MSGRPETGGGGLPPRSAIRGVWPAVRVAARAAPGWLGLHVGGTVLAALLPVLTVWLLKDVLDGLTSGRSRFPPSAYGLVAAGLATVLLPPVARYAHNQLGRLVSRRAQSDLYLATGRLAGLARLEDPAFRDRLQLAQQAGRSGPGQVVDGVAGIAQGLLTLTGLLVVLAAINPVMAGVALLATVPALLAEIQLSRARTRMMWGITPLERREFFYADLLTSLPAAKELRLLGLGELFRRRMLGELGAADSQRRRMDGRELRVQVSLGVLSAIVAGAGLLWAVAAAVDGRLGVGDVSAFITAMGGLQTGLGALVLRVSTVYQALLLYDHYRAVLRAGPDLPVHADPRPAPPLAHGIELRDVWFRYGPGQPWVLRGVDLVIPKGLAVALVGLNGAGKSTLVKLLCRFYDPERGEIRWDGVDLRELSVASLRERVGAVFQDYMTYDLSAAENIGLGDVTALEDDDRIRAAAARAGVHDTIEALPRGYRTMLSRMYVDSADAADAETGVLLSGGQWQRLALARAFLRDRRDLLILDEPSSGLDAVAEHEIHRRLRAHRAGATSVLISHRLGAVRDADRIVVLDGGRVTEQGTHADLLAAGGEYARLFQLQAQGYAEEPAAPPFGAFA